MKRNPQYEAGFVRARVEDHYERPEGRLDERRGFPLRKLSIALVVVLLVGAAGSGAYLMQRDTRAGQRARAKAYADQNDHRKASVEYKLALQDDPQQPEVRFLLGRELTALGESAAAEIEYRKALEIGYPPERGLVALVGSVLDQHRFDDVVALVNAGSIKTRETNAELQTMLGTAYLGLGRPDAGAAAFARARDLIPGYSGAAIAEARDRMAKHDYAGAQALLDAVATNDARYGDALTLRGDVARAAGQPREAATAYEAALKIRPDDLPTRQSLAEIYLDLGEPDQARTQIDVVRNVLPNSGKVQFITASVARLRHDLPAAREASDKAVAYSPFDGKTQALAGVIAFESDRLTEAETHLREAIRLLPQDVEAREWLARLYLQRQEPIKADAALAPAVEAMPTDREVGTLAAQIALQRGDLAKASQLFDRIGVVDASDTTASLAAASLRFAAGNAAAGFAQLEAAARANPSDPDIDATLITYRLQQHQVEPAQSAWQRLAARQPQSARTYALQASIDQARNDAVAARRSLEKALSIDPQYFPALAALAALDVQQERMDQARQRLTAFIATSPRPTDALLLLAQIEGSHGGSADTVSSLLERARQSDPRSQRVVVERVAFHRRHDDPQHALEAVRDGLALAPNDQTLLLAGGDLAMAMGKPQEATGFFSRLTALNSEDPDFPSRLGVAEAMSGQYENALTTFRGLLKSHPTRADLQARMIAALLDAKAVDEADRALFEVSKATPDSPILAECGGDILIARLKLPEGIAAYRRAMTSAPSSTLVVKFVDALDQAGQHDEADAVLAQWTKGHPQDEPVVVFAGRRARGLAPRAGNG